MKKSKVLKWLSAVSLTAAILALVGYRYITDWMGDAYDSMQVGYLIVDYMDDNNGSWPRSWEELRPYHERRYSPDGREMHFTQLQERVEVDWSADPNALLRCSQDRDPPFEVVRCKSGRRCGPTYQHEPNRVILEYLKWSQNNIRDNPD